MAAKSACLYSVVKNTSGATKKFGFLPPHGRELANNEEYTVFGNIAESVNRGEWVTSKRHRDALDAALVAGTLEVIETPCIILYDETLDVSKALELDNSALADVDPGWASS